MPKIFIFLIALLVFAVIPPAIHAAGKRPAEAWNYYHFDGISFTSGPTSDGSAFIAIREQSRPVVLTNTTAFIEQVALPDGEGVIAGLCYLQSTGGKLNSSGFKPYPRVPLLISSGGKPLVTVQTDDHGFFVAVLPVGTYSVGSGPFTAEITVERGITTLVPLRAGKRMVD